MSSKISADQAARAFKSGLNFERRLILVVDAAQVSSSDQSGAARVFTEIDRQRTPSRTLSGSPQFSSKLEESSVTGWIL
jgi:hypothetical protein